MMLSPPASDLDSASSLPSPGKMNHEKLVNDHKSMIDQQQQNSSQNSSQTQNHNQNTSQSTQSIQQYPYQSPMLQYQNQQPPHLYNHPQIHSHLPPIVQHNRPFLQDTSRQPYQDTSRQMFAERQPFSDNRMYQDNRPYQESPPYTDQHSVKYMSPHVEDILTHDLTLRFYTTVKEIKRQNNPHLLGDMFFALQHAIGDTIPWYKERNDHRAVFLFGSTTYVSHFAAANTVDIDQQAAQAAAAHAQQAAAATAAAAHQRGENPAHHQMAYQMFSRGNSNSPPMSDLSPRPALGYPRQQPLQPQTKLQLQYSGMPSQAPLYGPLEKRKLAAATSGDSLPEDRDWQTSKKGKKTHLKEKDLDTRRQELFHDLMRVTRAELHHSASLLSQQTKDLIRNVMLPIPPTKPISSPSASSALQRLATLANTSPHSDVDYAPKNSGVYFNHDYAELYRCFLLFERDVGANQPTDEPKNGATTLFTNLDSPAGKPIVRLLRARLEPLLTSTTWEAFKRRLTVGERVYTLTSELGGAFLLLSRAVSGRKLLHGFSNAEWREAIQSGIKSTNELRHVLGANEEEVKTLRSKFQLEQYLNSDLDQDMTEKDLESSRTETIKSNGAAANAAAVEPAHRSVSVEKDPESKSAPAPAPAPARRTRKTRVSDEQELNTS